MLLSLVHSLYCNLLTHPTITGSVVSLSLMYSPYTISGLFPHYHCSLTLLYSLLNLLLYFLIHPILTLAFLLLHTRSRYRISLTLLPPDRSLYSRLLTYATDLTHLSASYHLLTCPTVTSSVGSPSCRPIRFHLLAHLTLAHSSCSITCSVIYHHLLIRPTLLLSAHSSY